MSYELFKNEVLELSREHGLTDSRAIENLTRGIDHAIRHQIHSEAIEDLHKLFKATGEGQKFEFRSPVSMCKVMTDLSTVDEWVEVTSVRFYHYQPRKRLVWVTVPDGQLKNSQYRDNLQPMKLGRCVDLGMKKSRATLTS
tara:strand:+ start:1803 stop:2225 length:423 start_codon:yes stop_codon:yes gene_type:complete